VEDVLKDLGLAWAKQQPLPLAASLAILIIGGWFAYKVWNDAPEPKWQSPNVLLIGIGSVVVVIMASYAYSGAYDRCRAEWRSGSYGYVADRCDEVVHCDNGILPSPCGPRAQNIRLP